MGSETSKQKQEKQDLKQIQQYLKYASNMKINRMLMFQNMKTDQEMDTHTNAQKLFDDTKNIPKNQIVSEWIKIMVDYCQENQEQYTWAERYLIKIKECVVANKLTPISQTGDQNKLVWVLASMFDFDMQTRYKINQEGFKYEEEENQEELDAIYSISGVTDSDTGQPNKPNAATYFLDEATNFKRNQKLQKESQINDAIRCTDIFMEDIEQTLKNVNISPDQQNNSQMRNNININQNTKIDNAQCNNKKSSYDSNTDENSDFQSIKFEDDQQENKNNNNSSKTSNKSPNKSKFKENKEENANTIELSKQTSTINDSSIDDCPENCTQSSILQNHIKSMSKEFESQRKIQHPQKIVNPIFSLRSDEQPSQFNTFTSGTESNSQYLMRSESYNKKKKVNYQHNLVIINQQQQNKYSTKKQQVRMVKMVGFYKKTTEFFEGQFSNKRHIFCYFFREFKKQFLFYYRQMFKEIFEYQYNVKNKENNLQYQQSEFLQKARKISQYGGNGSKYFDNNQNHSASMQSEAPLELNFREYFDLATEEILEFIRLMCAILMSYYNINGLSKHRYGNLLEEENLHNFLVSYIFDDKIYSLLMQYQQQINFEKERLYCEKMVEFQSVTPDQLGIRTELQEISQNYNDQRIQKSQSTKLKQQNSFISRNSMKSQNSSQQQQSGIEETNSQKKQNNSNKTCKKSMSQNLVYQDIIQMFSNLPFIPSPVHKLKLLVRCNEMIVREIEKVQQEKEAQENLEDSSNNNQQQQQQNNSNLKKKKKETNLDSDDIMNAYVYIIGKSGVLNLFSQLQLIECFMNQNQRLSHTGYFYTTTFSAAMYLLHYGEDTKKQHKLDQEQQLLQEQEKQLIFQKQQQEQEQQN